MLEDFTLDFVTGVLLGGGLAVVSIGLAGVFRAFKLAADAG